MTTVLPVIAARSGGLDIMVFVNIAAGEKAKVIGKAKVNPYRIIFLNIS